jgi:hypothetical protein
MEVEAESLDEFEETSRKAMESEQLQAAMKGDHDRSTTAGGRSIGSRSNGTFRAAPRVG